MECIRRFHTRISNTQVSHVTGDRHHTPHNHTLLAQLQQFSVCAIRGPSEGGTNIWRTVMWVMRTAQHMYHSLLSCPRPLYMNDSSRPPPQHIHTLHARAYTHIHTHIHTRTHKHTRKHRHKYKHEHTYSHTHKHTNTQAHTLSLSLSLSLALSLFHTHKHTHTHIHAHTHTHTHAYTQIHTYTRTHTHTHTHTH